MKRSQLGSITFYAGVKKAEDVFPKYYRNLVD